MGNWYFGVLSLVIAAVTGAFAAYKGYDFWFWIYAGMLLPLIVLFFLPFANSNDIPESERLRHRKTANIIGGALTACNVLQSLLIFFVFRL